MPGFNRSILLSSPSSLSAYPGTSGRGPTKLISPISTFQSSGNSSSLYLRNFAPSGVMRLSPFTEIELSEWPTVMERNLYIVNNFPCCPTLRCLKITGPPGIFRRIKIPTIIKTGDKKISPKSAAPRSKKDLKNMDLMIHFLYPVYKPWRE